MKTLKKTFIALFIAAAFIKPVAAQTKAEKKTAKEAEVKELVTSKKFIFKANYAYPQNGGSRYLDYGYDVRFTGDSVISYLPYFGEVYSGAGYNSSSDNGVKFTSTEFEYNAEQKKNGSWYITIKPKDTQNITQLIYTVQVNGRADLAVISPNRQRISFNGEIISNDKHKK